MPTTRRIWVRIFASAALIVAGCAGTKGAGGGLDATTVATDGTIAVTDAGPETQGDIGAVGPAALDATEGRTGEDAGDGGAPDAVVAPRVDGEALTDAGTDSAAQDASQPDAGGAPADAAPASDAADGTGATDGAATDTSTAPVDAGTADVAVQPDPCPSQPLPKASGPDAPPKPDESNCTLPAPKFFDGAPPPETLVPVLGVRSSKGYAWWPLQDGAWLGMHVGPQGSFHVFSAYRVEVKGVNGPYAKMQVETWLSDGCTQIAKGQKPISFDYPVFGKKSSYGNSEKGEVGTLVVFGNPAVDVPKFCGRWARLHVRVKHKASGAWGSTSRLVRLYDAGKK